MYFLKHILLVPMVLMSLSTGLAKVRQMPQETKFFEDIGISIIFLILLGAVQVIGALLSMFIKTRKKGAILMALGFAISAILIFTVGDNSVTYISMLGYISLISALLSAAIAVMPWGPKAS